MQINVNEIQKKMAELVFKNVDVDITIYWYS